MAKTILFSLFIAASAVIAACSGKKDLSVPEEALRHRVIFDTDANNELDDQHALAYLLLNPEVFEVEAVTVNTTYSGGDIDLQYQEAERVMRLVNLHGKVPLLKGANGSFPEIRSTLDSAGYDGSKAVDFIITRAMATSGEKLLLLMVGKLTNAALALEKEPAIADKVKILWLGSNYPDPGEYNQDNDTAAMNYLLDQQVELEIALVRYGNDNGTDAVRASLEEIRSRMPGKGPVAEEAVEGRHGGTFRTFGDYSVNLFEHIGYHGDSKTRALFDMAAVAILKNPAWASPRTIPAPRLVDNRWQDRPDNTRTIVLWENFDRDGIMADFYATMEGLD
jgi:purine nucleosidase